MISITAMMIIMWLTHSKAILALGVVSHYKAATEEEGGHGACTKGVDAFMQWDSSISFKSEVNPKGK